MGYECRVEKDSVTWYGERLTTIVMTLPRIVLAELNTHRVFSRSSASSRAIPVQKQIERLRADPFLPVYWGKNQKGMQAEEELTPERIALATQIWIEAAEQAIASAEKMLEMGVHKQITNRLLEPFMWHTVIITATEWSNFDHLRRNKHAQPEIRKAAEMVWACMDASRPRRLGASEWHLPFVDDATQWGEDYEEDYEVLVPMSTGRSARVSYLNHDGLSDEAADIQLAASLLQNGHMAPWEHIARPMSEEERGLFRQVAWIPNPSVSITGPSSIERWIPGPEQHFLGNFNGWVQARKLIHGERDILAQSRLPTVVTRSG